MPTAKQIRQDFIEFFKNKRHSFVPSSPIIPAGDDTILFANAGMNQFKDIFLGLKTPEVPCAVNSQKCLRVSGKHNDLEEVGRDTYHHTFFEMLGNWSFDDYFKAEAIEWAWQLLTEVWKIPQGKLWATVFEGDPKDNLPKDQQAADIWTKVTSIAPEHVLAFGKKDNFWEMGNTGPCGPCSEIHIDLGPDRCDKKNTPGHKCAVNAGCGRFIELWNLVFIQYNHTDKELIGLKAKYVDTGAGLERLVAVLQNKPSNYDTDLFMPIIEAIAEITNHKYTAQLNSRTDTAFRVIADHIRALTFAITDGGTPSNEARGYVLRRILRRAARFGRELDMHQPFIHKLVPIVAECLGDTFPEINQRIDFVSTVIESEETSFGRTLDRGIDIFNAAAERAEKSPDRTINGRNAFQLYDTYGFPLDLTQLMAKECSLNVDTDKFAELMDQQRQRARAAQKTTSVIANLADTELPATEDLHKYHTDKCQATILGWIDENGFNNNGTIEGAEEIGIVLDKTCFYAEAGGQVGDCGTIAAEGARFIVEDTTKIADSVVHKGHLVEGTFEIGQNVTAQVSKDRDAIKKNHTATHLLQWALQNVIDKSVAQQGSFVCPEYLRFDFTCPAAPTDQQLREVENLVRAKIAEKLPVVCAVMPRKQAQKLGAMALFGEKYTDEVRIVAIGTEDPDQLSRAFSKEFCGGTHVENIGSVGGFKIIREESISAGVRRITALTGAALADYLEKRSDTIDQLSQMLKIPAEDLPKRVTQLIEENKKLVRQLKSAAKHTGTDVISQARKLLDNCQRIGSAAVIVAPLPNATIDQARQAIDMLKKKAKSAAIVLGLNAEDKAILIVGVTDDLIKQGIKAGDIVREISPIIDGGGGGRPQMAQAGGKKPENISQALQKATKFIEEKLRLL